MRSAVNVFRKMNRRPIRNSVIPIMKRRFGYQNRSFALHCRTKRRCGMRKIRRTYREGDNPDHQGVHTLAHRANVTPTA